MVDEPSDTITLRAILPDGTVTNVSLPSSTQMMDVLIKITAANKLKPTDHMIKIVSNGNGRNVGFLSSQTIGSLKADTVHVVTRKDTTQKPCPEVPVIDYTNAKEQAGKLPFELTYRLTVNLPRQQKTFIRVSPRISLRGVFEKVCAEKELDPSTHALRHPTNPQAVLDRCMTLMDYQLSEITIAKQSALQLHNSASSPQVSAFSAANPRHKRVLCPEESQRVTVTNLVQNENDQTSRSYHRTGHNSVQDDHSPAANPGSGHRHSMSEGTSQPNSHHQPYDLDESNRSDTMSLGPRSQKRQAPPPPQPLQLAPGQVPLTQRHAKGMSEGATVTEESPENQPPIGIEKNWRNDVVGRTALATGRDSGFDDSELEAKDPTDWSRSSWHRCSEIVYKLEECHDYTCQKDMSGVENRREESSVAENGEDSKKNGTVKVIEERCCGNSEPIRLPSEAAPANINVQLKSRAKRQAPLPPPV